MRVKPGKVGEEGDVRHSVRVDVRPISLRPGDTAEAVIYIHGPGVGVSILATPSDDNIRVLSVIPQIGRTPLQVRMIVSADRSSKPGFYEVNVAILDADQERLLVSARIPVIVVDMPALREVINDIDSLQRLYREKGIQYALIHALLKLGMRISFSYIKLLYEIIAGRRVSKGTVGDLLKRLLRKGILRRAGTLYYINTDLEAAKSIIDTKRAKSGLIGASKTSAGKSGENGGKEIEGIPTPIRKALKTAEDLLKKDRWLGVDFIAHTLLGIRKTGLWLLWHGDYFLYYEGKTHFLHYFRSPWLSSLLKDLGLEQGLMVEHESYPSEKYIVDLYGSYANARRIHYILKQLGWFEYGEPLLIELGNGYLVARGLLSKETLFRYGELNTQRTLKVIAYPGEHVDEESEETYFYRPANLY